MEITDLKTVHNRKQNLYRATYTVEEKGKEIKVHFVPGSNPSVDLLPGQRVPQGIAREAVRMVEAHVYRNGHTHLDYKL
jgi:hypothetical protein